MLNRKYFCLTTICFLLLTQNLFSQITLEGVVTDNGAEYLGNGAEPVVNALVILTDQGDAQRTFSAITNAQGHYSIQIPTTGVDNPDVSNPGSPILYQNYPNPFNPSTVISYEISKPSQITIDIYNVLGQKIKTLFNGYQAAGLSQKKWDGTNESGQGVPAGVYIYSLRGKGIIINKKMLLIDGKQCSANAGMSHATVANISDVNLLKKQLSDEYTLTVTGTNIAPNIAPYEQQNLKITESMTQDITVTRTLTDINGNVYQTVKIGDQWWMAENLKVRHYRNGEGIPEVTLNNTWSGLSTGARCVYDNDRSNADTYGYLYNWYAVDDSRNIAPEGWHVPSDEEWKTLEIYLGMSQSEADDIGLRGTNEGSKLAGRADLWITSNLENNQAFGESGFSALAAGDRGSNVSAFFDLGDDAALWSATQTDASNAWYRFLYCTYSAVNRSNGKKQGGFSVRLIRD